MNGSIVCVLMGFMGTTVCILLMRPIAVRVGLVDRPGGRKQHRGEVPLVGGMALVSGCLVLEWIMVGAFVTVAIYMLAAEIGWWLIAAGQRAPLEADAAALIETQQTSDGYLGRQPAGLARRTAASFYGEAVDNRNGPRARLNRCWQ